MKQPAKPKGPGRPSKEQGYTRSLVSVRLSQSSYENAQTMAERSGLKLGQVIDAVLAQAPQHPSFAPLFHRTPGRLFSHTSGLPSIVGTLNQAGLAFFLLEGKPLRVTYASSAMEATLPGRQLLGLPLPDVIPSGGSGWSQLESAFASGTTGHLKGVRVQTQAEAAEREFDFVFQPVLVDGAVESLLAIATDITPLSALKQQHEKTQSRLTAYEAGRTRFSWTVGPRGAMREFSSWSRLTGQTPEASRGLGYMAALHPDDQAAFVVALDQAQTSGYASFKGLRVYDASGLSLAFDLEVWGARDSTAPAGELVCVLQDAQARRQLETELEEARARVAALEEGLALAEGRTEALMAQTLLSVQRFDLDGRTLATNQAFERLWGLSTEQLWAFNYNLFQDPQLEAQGVMPMIHRAYAGEAGPISLFRFDPEEHGMSGQRRWAEAYAQPVRDAQGRVRELMLLHLDRTAQKGLEDALHAAYDQLRRADVQAATQLAGRLQELRESEERFRLLAEAAFEGVAVIKDGQIMDTNPAMAAMLGYQPADLIGRKVSEFVAEDERLRVEERFRTGTHSQTVVTAIHRDGRRIPFELRSTEIFKGNVPYRVSVLRDITEEFVAKKFRAEQDLLMRQLGDAIALPLAMVDRDLTYIWNNQAHCDLVGRPREAIVGRPVGEVVERNEDQIRQLHRRALAGEEFRVKGLHAPIYSNGKLIGTDWDILYMPLRGLDQEVIGFLTVAESVLNAVQPGKGTAKGLNDLIAGLADHSPMPVLRWDRRMRHRYVNAAAASRAGSTPELMQGKTYEELDMPPQAAAFFQGHIRHVLDTGTITQVEFTDPVDGQTRFQASFMPDLDRAGRIQGVWGLARQME